MAEPRRAPSAGPNLQIAITYSNNQWVADPPKPPPASVDNGGQVTFHCAPAGGCRVFTFPPDAFVNEVNGYEQLNQGNNTYNVNPAHDDSFILYCVCGPNETCPPTGRVLTGGYSIQSGNPPEGGDKGKKKD